MSTTRGRRVREGRPRFRRMVAAIGLAVGLIVGFATVAAPAGAGDHAAPNNSYAVTNLVVSRAGMLTVAELCAWGLPSILIPLPTAAADHQIHNARVLARDKSVVAAAILAPAPLRRDPPRLPLTPLRPRRAQRLRLPRPPRLPRIRNRPPHRQRPHRRCVRRRLRPIANESSSWPGEVRFAATQRI